MAIVSVNKFTRGDQPQAVGTYDIATFTSKLQYIEAWQVLTDDVTYTDSDILFATAGGNTIPQLGNNYIIGKTNQSMTCTRVQPRRDKDNPKLYRVTVEYSIQPQASKGAQGAKTNITLSSRGQDFEFDAYRDKDGNSILNSAGDAFDPTIKDSRSDDIISITFDSNSVDVANIVACRGKVNSDSITLNVKNYTDTFAPRTMLLKDATFSLTYSQGTASVWHISYVLHIRKDVADDGSIGWSESILDRGYRHWNAAKTKRVNNVDDNGNPTSGNMLLDGGGYQLFLPAGVSKGKYRTFKVKLEAPFGPLLNGIS